MSRPAQWRWIFPILCLVALLVFPAHGEKFYLQLVSKIMILSIFALSLDLLVGFAGLVSFGHAAFFGVGAYALMLMSPADHGANLLLSLVFALAAAALAALVVGVMVLRSSGAYFIMATLAFAQMFYYAVSGSKRLGGSDGAYIYVKPDASILGWKPIDIGDSTQFYYLVLAALVASFLLLRVVLASPFGHALRGIKANENRMRSLGYAPFRYKLAAFVIAGALAGLAGYLDAAQFGFVSPDLFGWRQSGLALMMVILGGAGTRYGPILGAFAMVLLQDTLTDMTRHWLLPMGLFIIVAVLAMPGGIRGLATSIVEMRRARVGRGV